MKRKAAVAGQFYPGSREQLLKQIDELVDKNAKKENAIACLMPHAGYIYSGAVAGKTISRIKIPDNILIIGPNHTGFGGPFSIMTDSSWETPLGEIAINNQLAEEMLSNSSYLKEDAQAHISEHSLEVELPFLQYFKSDFKIVPIVVSHATLSIYKALAKEIVSVLKKTDMHSDILIIASSDMTHYEQDKIARKKDKEAIDAILDLDEDKLLDKIEGLDISMCGYAPAIIMIVMAKELGAKRGELVSYQTSAEASGDYSSVVGYAGIILN